ncbi:MAG: hypothetical protein AAF790_10560 [Planctomycetota bacterium]
MHNTPEPCEATLAQVDMLVSAMVDEVLTEQQQAQLAELLESDAGARVRYIEGVQLHADLIQHFKDLGAAGAGQASPILTALQTSGVPLAGEGFAGGGVALPPGSGIDQAD